MANKIIEKIIKITTDVEQAGKDMLDFFNNIIGNQDKAIENQSEFNEKVADTGKNAKKSTSAIDGMAKGFKGVGLAIKAMGIGLLLAAMDVLKNVFMSNQKVVDAFSTAMNFLKIAFNDLFGFIERNVGPVVDYFKSIFDDPMKSIEDLGNAIKDNLIERFMSMLDVIGYLGESIKKFFEGDFEGAALSVKNAVKEMADVYTGVNNTVDRTTKAIGDFVDAAGNYITKTYEAADAQTKLSNSVALAIARNEGLVEVYDEQAEKLRQLRDDESSTIADRIKASDLLKLKLVEQGKAMRENASLLVQEASLNYTLNNSIENQAALIRARNGLKSIDAKITGLQSEQQVSHNGLIKENNALIQTSIDGINARAIANKKFTDSLIKDSTDRIEIERQSIQQEYDLELERLENKRKLYKEGTQAYADAQEEILNLQANTSEALIMNDRTMNETLSNEHFSRLNRIIGDEMMSFDERYAALDEQLVAINEKEYSSEEERTAALKANTDARKALGNEEYEAKKTMLNSMAGALDNASALLGESTAAGKAMAVAAATVSTYVSAVDAYKGMVAAIPGPGGIAAGAVAAAASVAMGLGTVKKILAVKTPGKSTGGGVPGGGATVAAPQFNVVGQSGENQLATTIAGRQGQPVEAFVVGQSVTTQQSMDRNIVNNATFM